MEDKINKILQHQANTKLPTDQLESKVKEIQKSINFRQKDYRNSTQSNNSSPQASIQTNNSTTGVTIPAAGSSPPHTMAAQQSLINQMEMSIPRYGKTGSWGGAPHSSHPDGSFDGDFNDNPVLQ